VQERPSIGQIRQIDAPAFAVHSSINGTFPMSGAGPAAYLLWPAC
jgi:hypothetical protein